MARECPSCGSGLYHTMLVQYPKNGDALYECSECSRISMTQLYDDVYLGPGGGIKTDPNLVDPKTGREIPFHTKQDKAVIMKMLGVRQADSADRKHGYRNEEYLHRRKHFEMG